MYRLSLGRKSSLDLGAGERPCLTCANISAEPSEWRGYVCTRFVDPVDGIGLTCYEARINGGVCGPNADGWEALGEDAVTAEETKADSRWANDLRVGGGSCADCRHGLTPGVSCSSVHRCARLVTPLTGEPESCEVARNDSNLCGWDGAWFEPKLEIDEVEESHDIPVIGDAY